MKGQSESSLLSGQRSQRGERIVEIDGTLTTQPVLEHVRISTWPGMSSFLSEEKRFLVVYMLACFFNLPCYGFISLGFNFSFPGTGRLTLTDHALYFEALRVVTYDKPKAYELAEDLKQSVKPELTGPWGSRLFDKAVMYKSATL